MSKEASIGIINVWFWVAASFGGLVPLVLRAMKTDPALASGPLLTTITDMCGFFFVPIFASFLLPKLAG